MPLSSPLKGSLSSEDVKVAQCYSTGNRIVIPAGNGTLRAGVARLGLYPIQMSLQPNSLSLPVSSKLTDWCLSKAPVMTTGFKLSQLKRNVINFFYWSKVFIS